MKTKPWMIPKPWRWTAAAQLSHATLIAAAVCAGGCEALPSSEGLVNRQDELASGFGNTPTGADADSFFTTPWRSPGTVNVCYVGPVTGPGDTDAPDPGRMATVQAVLAASWQPTIGLTFVHQGRCPSSIPTDWVSVFLQEVNSNGQATGGIGNRLWADPLWDNRTDIETRFGDRPGEYLRQAVHEFGHVLGFYHEFQRTEAQGTNCDLTPNSRSALGHLTPYDPNSIMSWSYNCPSERTETNLLSQWDRLGAEMMYPKMSTGYPLACAAGCFRNSAGAVVRTDGGITIDWVARGADVDPTWHVGSNNYTATDGVLLASLLPSTTNPVTMEFYDAYTNPNSNLYVPDTLTHPSLTGGGTAVKSNALHAAYTMSTFIQ